MTFDNIKSVTIPEGVVTEIKQGETVLWKAKTKRLPDAYQEVEWIKPLEAKLALPADTMEYGYASFKVSFPNKQPSSYDLAHGGSSSSATTRFALFTTAPGDILRVTFEFTNIDVDGVRQDDIVWDTFDPSNAFVARWDGDNLYLGSKITSSVSQYFYKQGWYLFGRDTRAYNYGGELTVYEVTMGQYTFVPCYRKSDNVIGMYMIGRTSPSSQYGFLTSTEGSFEKGADV